MKKISKIQRKLFHKVNLILLLIVMIAFSCQEHNTTQPKIGSVIFLHPDGSSMSAWAALRLLEKGPDGNLNWDTLERMGVYRGHLKNSAVSSSNGGATAHAFGVKCYYDDYGINPEDPIKSLSGKDYSVMVEAQKAGKSIGVINSGHICEPGTGCFLANAEKRSMEDDISLQIINSNADVIMSGGEVLLLPEGVMGRHGKPGERKDGKNLIQLAEQLGYTVIYTRDELLALPDNVEKVLGVFAPGHTFNDETEEDLKEDHLPLYLKTAPTVAEMAEAALKVFKRKGKDFLLVIEEEGTDNFANKNNAMGTLEALSHADAAIGVVLKFIKDNPNTLLLTAADSDAGGLNVIEVYKTKDLEKPLKPTMKNGAPLDGREGTESLPFIAKPDRFGNQLRFGIAWASRDDVAGGILARAHGLNSHLLPKNVDNTDIYRMMYVTLFGKWLK